jgi:peroxiredoxin
LILWRASEQYRAEPGAGAPLDEDKLLREARTTTGATVAALSEDRPVLLVFLRHAGCTFCREAMADLAARRGIIEARGTTVVLVHMGAAAEFARFAGEYGLDDLPAVSDPERQLYRALGLRRGRWSQLLGPTVWWRGFQAWKSGHAVGSPAGDVMQMPGTFLVFHGRVIRRFLHTTASDRPDYAGLCELPASI